MNYVDAIFISKYDPENFSFIFQGANSLETVRFMLKILKFLIKETPPQLLTSIIENTRNSNTKTCIQNLKILTKDFCNLTLETQKICGRRYLHQPKAEQKSKDWLSFQRRECHRIDDFFSLIHCRLQIKSKLARADRCSFVAQSKTTPRIRYMTACNTNCSHYLIYIHFH